MYLKELIAKLQTIQAQVDNGSIPSKNGDIEVLLQDQTDDAVLVDVRDVIVEKFIKDNRYYVYIDNK